MVDRTKRSTTPRLPRKVCSNGHYSLGEKDNIRCSKCGSLMEYNWRCENSFVQIPSTDIMTPPVEIETNLNLVPKPSTSSTIHEKVNVEDKDSVGKSSWEFFVNEFRNNRSQCTFNIGTMPHSNAQPSDYEASSLGVSPQSNPFLNSGRGHGRRVWYRSKQSGQGGEDEDHNLGENNDFYQIALPKTELIPGGRGRGRGSKKDNETK